MSELYRAVRIVALVIALMILVFGGLGAMHVFGIPVVCIALFVVFLAITRRWANRKRRLLYALAAASERGMPLVPVIEAHGRENNYSTWKRAGEMTTLLNAGHGLGVAAQSVPGLLPASAKAPIRLGEEAGDMAAGLRLAAGGDISESPIWLSFAGKVVYISACVVFFVFILTFVFLKIVPAYQDIFCDFELEFPDLTKSVIEGSGSLAGVGSLIALPLFLISGVLSIGTVLWCFGAFRGAPPGTFWLLGRFASADIMEALALSIEKGRPVEESIHILSHLYVDATARRRLSWVLTRIEGGWSWIEALHAKRLLNASDVHVLTAAAEARNLPWALRERARTARHRLMCRLYTVLQIVFPAVVLALGTLVGVVVIGLFIPLITIINSLI